MAYLTSDNTPLYTQSEALYPSGSTHAIPGSNTATSFTIPMGSIVPSGASTAFDARGATIIIANNGTSQTINAAVLSFSDMVGAQTATITYSLPSVSIASGASQQFTVQFSTGILKNMFLAVTFAVAPVAGSADVQTLLQGGGSGGTATTQSVEGAGYVAASGGAPTTTNAGSDTAYTFSSQLNVVILQNNTAATLNFAFDTAASAGSLVLAANAMLIYPKKVTTVHLYTAATTAINGTASGNIVLLGSL